jgi:mannose-6-phosphate isomerase
MGTHPKAPSVVSSSGEALSQWLTNHPEAVGEKVMKRFPLSGQLPFLFKVLSVNKSLSIQAHPNKVCK